MNLKNTLGLIIRLTLGTITIATRLDGLTRRESKNDNNNQMLREVPPMRFLILEPQWGAKGIDKADIYPT
jgi:hypothetical protein